MFEIVRNKFLLSWETLQKSSNVWVVVFVTIHERISLTSKVKEVNAPRSF